MWVKQLIAPWTLLLLLEVADHIGIAVADCDESSLHGHVHSSPAIKDGSLTGMLKQTIDNGLSADIGEEAGGSNSSDSNATITFPEGTTSSDVNKWSTDSPTVAPAISAITAPPMTETPTTAVPSAPIDPMNAPNEITSEGDTGTQSTNHGVATETPNQSTAPTDAPIITASGASQSSGASSVTSTDPSADSAKLAGEPPIASAEPDSSTFQLVGSEVCSETVVENVYTLYANCRSAFDMCVSASNYQIFPFAGEHPTQSEIQSMAESDACVAMFIIVLKANLPACTIGGMPLVSAVETLLKISVDLENGSEAPSADGFRKLVSWRYEVDLAKAAGAPYDSDSELFADFEANLNSVLVETAIRVNEDLSVDVRLSNGSYESFEDALDVVITDASIDAAPGYVKASSAEVDTESSSSQSAEGIVSETSNALRGCTSAVWSIVAVVVVVVVAAA